MVMSTRNTPRHVTSDQNDTEMADVH
jgi:methyl-accepting chemotaxis protein